MKLSNFLTYERATYSETAIRKGIKNEPTPAHLENLKYLGAQLDKIFEVFPDLKVNSVYRGKALNTAIGGSLKSFHCSGCAADIETKNNAALFNWIRANMQFTELIWEFGDDKQPAWIHLGIVKGRENEREVLKAVSINKRTTYQVFK